MNHTSNLRRLMFAGGWTIIASGRGQRPRNQVSQQPERTSPGCHFCTGNEAQTEPEVFAIRPSDSNPDSAGWSLRVVPNKYPALGPQPMDRRLDAFPHQQMSGNGLHEVVIETHEHDARFALLPEDQLATILSVYRDRVDVLSRKPGVKSVALFRNQGETAGASQQHPHAQILALQIIGGRLGFELEMVRRHYRRRGSCPTCETLAQGTTNAERLICRNDDFTAIASFAPRFPYETWIVPNVHASDYRDCSVGVLSSLAAILKKVLGGLEAVLGRFSHNLVLQTRPGRLVGVSARAFHWRMEILPRLTVPSGFELGSEVFIVDVQPVEAAARLRVALNS